MRPPPTVLAAFGISAEPEPLAGGSRTAWRCGDLVLKPLDISVEELDAGPSQLVHGDLTGNVLFAAGLPPAVIDFSPYWRPTGFASAVVVGDALLWEGADVSLLTAVAHVEDFPQLLVRALIFRAVVDALGRAGKPERPDDDDCFLAPVELACSLAARTA
jgi:hypothetical protein